MLGWIKLDAMPITLRFILRNIILEFDMWASKIAHTGNELAIMFHNLYRIQQFPIFCKFSPPLN